MDELYDALASYGDDSELEIISFTGAELTLAVYLDVWRGQKYIISLPNVGHLDISPFIWLGRVCFGDITLLPPNYLDTRWEGLTSEENLRVMKITDPDDELHFFIVYDGQETFKEVADDDPILQGTRIGEHSPRY